VDLTRFVKVDEAAPNACGARGGLVNDIGWVTTTLIVRSAEIQANEQYT
jgi:hypothetical protein